MDPKSRDDFVKFNDEQLDQPRVLDEIANASVGCDCGAGDLCTSVILTALIAGTANRDQQRDAAVQVLRRIFEMERREAVREAFKEAIQMAAPPAGSEKGH